MKNLIMICCFLFIIGCNNKKENIEPNYNINNENLKSQTQTREFLFLGDSQMDKNGSLYSVFINKLPSYNATKIAKGGQTTQWLLDTLQLINPYCTDAVIFIGTNDIYQNVNSLITKSNLQNIISNLKNTNPECKILFCTIAPSRNSHVGNIHYWNINIGIKSIELNNYIKALNLIENIDIIDIYGMVDDGNMAIQPVFDNGDGLHLNNFCSAAAFPILRTKLNI